MRVRFEDEKFCSGRMHFECSIFDNAPDVAVGGEVRRNGNMSGEGNGGIEMVLILISNYEWH